MPIPSFPAPQYAQAQGASPLLAYELPPSYDAIPHYNHPPPRTSKTKHRKKKHAKARDHRSRKHEFAAYVLQIIGVLCLVLAALKAFEPLAGVGFTLVMMGFKGGRVRERKKEKKERESAAKNESDGKGKEAKETVALDVKIVLDGGGSCEGEEDWEIVERMD